MSVIKEFRCKKHGNFESSHPICPALGCDSSHVERVFLTPVGIKSEFVSRHEKGIKRLATAYGQSDFKTARAGESSIKHPVGQQVLWGNDIQKHLGMDINALTAAAARPFVVEKPDGSRETVPQGMRLAATDPQAPDAPGSASVMGILSHHAQCACDIYSGLYVTGKHVTTQETQRIGWSVILLDNP